MTYVYAALFALVLGAVFALGTYWNKNTPKPEGCEEQLASCHGCRITSCEHHPSQNEESEER